MLTGDGLLALIVLSGRAVRRWVYGDAQDKVRMDRFRRSGEGADFYEQALRAEQAAALAEAGGGVGGGE